MLAKNTAVAEMLGEVKRLRLQTLHLEESARDLLASVLDSPVELNVMARGALAYTEAVVALVRPVFATSEIAGLVVPMHTELYPVRMYRDEDGLAHAVCRFFAGSDDVFNPLKVDVYVQELDNPSELLYFVRDNA